MFAKSLLSSSSIRTAKLNRRGFFTFRFSSLLDSFVLPFFNEVDTDRIKEIGPDRACAEWLVKNGSAVKWINSHKFVSDYSALPVGSEPRFKIKEVDATDSALHPSGFAYFRGLKHFQKLTLNNNK